MLACQCHKYRRMEAIRSKTFEYAFKITIFVINKNLGAISWKDTILFANVTHKTLPHSKFCFYLLELQLNTYFSSKFRLLQRKITLCCSKIDFARKCFKKEKKPIGLFSINNFTQIFKKSDFSDSEGNSTLWPMREKHPVKTP